MRKPTRLPDRAGAYYLSQHWDFDALRMGAFGVHSDTRASCISFETNTNRGSLRSGRVCGHGHNVSVI